MILSSCRRGHTLWLLGFLTFLSPACAAPLFLQWGIDKVPVPSNVCMYYTSTQCFSIGTMSGAGAYLVPVGMGGTGITSGTSGGIPYFASSSTLASSAALTANRIVLGGGAGVAPTVLGSLGTTSTLLHGNAAGAPSFGAVALATDVSGTLQAANFPVLTGDVTTPGGSLATTLAKLVLTSATQQKFTASGTYTPNAKLVVAIIECIGSGAGGGGVASSTSIGSGGGGGGGSYSRVTVTAATVGASQAVTVGAAGTGGAAGNNNGTNGADVSVGALCIGKGGSLGSGAAANASGLGGAGGVAGTGDDTFTGNAGLRGFSATIVTVASQSGAGGGGPFGGAPQPASATNTPGATSITGPVGAIYGAGGSGGLSVSSGAAAAGGNGAAGYVRVTEFNSQ